LSTAQFKRAVFEMQHFHNLRPQFLRLAVTPFIMRNSLYRYSWSWNEPALLGVMLRKALAYLI